MRYAGEHYAVRSLGEEVVVEEGFAVGLGVGVVTVKGFERG
jgi:hypothetical protein